MKCVICGKFYWNPICKKCLQEIKITPSTRIIEGIAVYSFYRYSDISILISSKYSVFGSRILKILAKKASKYFFDSQKENINLWKEIELWGVGIDDCVRSYYSHTGVILKEFCQYGIKPSYGKLYAKNIVRYAGKPLEYRQKNPRGFIYKDKKIKHTFILDDIITTGTTIKEAKNIIQKTGSSVIFAITLCDAKH
ncbi:ComF family protein [Helicobacter sp. 13S00477-4]|uniref:ComF family protein n=1 Tax=Helicobacter sp. 13S00477-4 TaxID=1905759 RepID=UPI000BA64990|nr:ComF family protein [Helicobacter sp. 13S00477-4]PAF50822.1 hypothetical protein BKH44_06630 [Helicobacter sp. 13S00477-4]